MAENNDTQRYRQAAIAIEPVTGKFFIDSTNHPARLKETIGSLEKIARDNLGLDVRVLPLPVVSRITEDGETWQSATTIMRFNNVTKSELEEYRDTLTDVLTGKDRHILWGAIGEYSKVPDPQVELVTKEWMDNYTEPMKTDEEAAAEAKENAGGGDGGKHRAPNGGDGDDTFTSSQYSQEELEQGAMF